MHTTEIKLEAIINEIGLCRSRILDDCELELGDTPRWSPLRSRILKVFGQRGLEGKVREILNYFPSNEVTNEK